MRRASVVTVLGLLLFLFPRSLADAAAPVLGNKPSFFPSVSGDGRYVAFASNATNLVTRTMCRVHAAIIP